MKLPEKNWLEWLVFGLSLILLAAGAAYLTYDALTLGDAPPVVSVALGAPERRADHFVVPVTLTNTGDRTAQDVSLEVTLAGGAEPEVAELMIAFLPRGATRDGWASFRGDPSAGELTARVVSYTQP